MADLAEPLLLFETGCPDCGERQAVLPPPLPGVADDFDWRARDYDSIRLFLMQELAYRFPERRRWTPADLEVVVVELLAAAFDRASHALDAVQAERFLETARRPQSVRRLLKLIGYDAAARVRDEVLAGLPPAPAGVVETRDERLERLWRLEPQRMEEARALGPRLIAEQRRMVTLDDHETVLAGHPLVARAQARLVWTGAWSTVLVSALLDGDRDLDTRLAAPGDNVETDRLWRAIRDFHLDNGLALPPPGSPATPRRLLRIFIERRRMIGSEVLLETAKPAAIAFTLSIRARPGYFRSEMRAALAAVFSAEDGGFFEPGRLDFGEDLYASDIIEAAMAIEGVAVACLNRFKRVGSGWPDRTAEGFIAIAEDEYVRCLNRRGAPDAGFFRIVVNGGEVG
ncbi:MAG: hypothetical protein ABW194_02525 [Novosphingobium sp.]